MIPKKQKSWIYNFFSGAINSPLTFLLTIIGIVSGQNYFKTDSSIESKLTKQQNIFDQTRIDLYNTRRSATELYEYNTYTLQRILELEKKNNIKNEFYILKSIQHNDNFLYLNSYNMTRGWNKNNIIPNIQPITDINLIP